MATATVHVRGCGTRVYGGIYAETTRTHTGRSMVDFLIDPPIPIDPTALGLTAVGVKMVRKNGVWHILDIVGQEHYPNVADMVEEIDRLGVSRRLPSSLRFDLLSPESRLILIHPRAVIHNAADYFEARNGATGMWWCPLRRTDHVMASRPPVMCASLWWEDLEGGTKNGGGAPRHVRRAMPSFVYEGHRRPDGVMPHYHHGMFANLPIGQLSVVKDPKGGSHQKALEKVQVVSNRLRVELVDA